MLMLNTDTFAGDSEIENGIEIKGTGISTATISCLVSGVISDSRMTGFAFGFFLPKLNQ